MGQLSEMLGSTSFDAKRRSKSEAAQRDALRETKVLGEVAIRGAERRGGGAVGFYGQQAWRTRKINRWLGGRGD